METIAIEILKRNAKKKILYLSFSSVLNSSEEWWLFNAVIIWQLRNVFSAFLLEP